MAGTNKYAINALQKGLEELELREMHPLRVYRPTVYQQPIHESRSEELLIAGGKRCLAGWQDIHDPETGVTSRIDSITHPFKVSSRDPSTGLTVTATASKPFIKGFGAIYRVLLSNGSSFCSTLEHRILGADGQWVSVVEAYTDRLSLSSCWSESRSVSSTGRCPERTGQALEPHQLPASHPAAPASLPSPATYGTSSGCLSEPHQPLLAWQGSDPPSTQRTLRSHRPSWSYTRTQSHHLAAGPLGESYLPRPGFDAGHPLSTWDACLLGWLADALCYSETAPGYPGDYSISHRPCGEQPPGEAVACQSSSPSLGDARGYSRHDWQIGDLDDKSWCSLPCPPARHLSRQHSQDASESQNQPSSSTRFLVNGRSHRLSAVGSARLRYIAGEEARRSDQLWFSLSHPSHGKSESETYITDIEFVKNDWIYDIEVDGTANYEIAGISHANSGKTISAVMEVGSRILGIPVTGHDGQEIPARFRVPRKNNRLLFWVIGLNIDHIGQTIYHRLFSPGLGCEFKIIRDLETAAWRSYNENHEGDKAREGDAVLCPPMIGEHMIVPGSWHMESSAGHIFKSVRLVNGATICAYPSTGDRPKMGDAVHGIWIDEDIAVPHFIKEWQDRLVTTNGWLIWSVWPQATNFALIDAMDRAEEKKDEEDPPIQCFMLEGSKNPYNSAKGIERGLDRMTDEEDLAHRDRGDIRALMGGLSMYSFAPAIHSCRARESKKPEHPHELICSLLQRYSVLPDEWTRYLVIDPSHTRTACLFGVVPPPEWEHVEMGKRLIIERELIVKRHTPKMFAEALRPLMTKNFEAFVMDKRAGRQTSIGNDTSVFWSYGREFQSRGFKSRLTNSGFLGGCDDKAERRRVVRAMMEPTENGWPALMIVEHATYGLQREFNKYVKKQVVINGERVITDDPVNERSMDAMAALEYLCYYVAERFAAGTAYVEPALARGVGSAAYQIAQAIKDKAAKAEGGGYAHMGPGAAA